MGNNRPLLLKEVILENFMSYEYARIPFKPGLNVICGPNASGKSSILIGIAVALGQTYTERSRKLSDLIRWGKDIARITLVFDNSNKALPHYPTATIEISRYLRKDGSYWFKINERDSSKEDVINMLKSKNIDPDNQLIIMHQGMIEDFVCKSPQEKLKMVEDVSGLSGYRENVLEAQRKLSEILSEEESIRSLLKNAEESLAYWKEQHEKYHKKVELLKRKEYLEREAAWIKVIRKEKFIESLQEQVKRKESIINYLLRKQEETKESIDKLNSELSQFNIKQRNCFHDLLSLEKEKSKVESTINSYNTFLEVIKGEELSERMKEYKAKFEDELKALKKELRSLNSKVKLVRSKLGRIERRGEQLRERYIKEKIQEAILIHQIKENEDDVKSLNEELSKAQEELKELIASAEAIGPRVDTKRSLNEVLEEMKGVVAHLMALGEVSEDADEMYKHHSESFNKLKEKLAVVLENKRIALEEVKLRASIWKKLIQDLIDDVNTTYQKILSKVGAIGKVRVSNLDNIEDASLELLVGFRGSKPSVLNAYTQSGGERSVSVMAFLIALQKHIKSPLRAIDEFDVHMDPRNRESIYEALASVVGNDFQCIVITPSPVVSSLKEVTNFIIVQSVEGSSKAMSLA